MADESNRGLGGIPQRIGNLVELLTTLDLKITGALESLEKMQTSVAAFEPVTAQADRFLVDVEARLTALDARINSDLDEVKAAIMAKLDGLDVNTVGPRLDRLEEAILNIERATVSFDQAMEGALGAMPDFLSRRIKGEGKRSAPDPALDGPTRRP